MIEGITTHNSERFLLISSSSSYNAGINTNTPGCGHMRYMHNRIEVYDGYTWVQLPTIYQSLDLTQDAKLALEWAMTKRSEEMMENLMLEKYPSLKSAKGQYDMIKQLCIQEENCINHQ